MKTDIRNEISKNWDPDYKKLGSERFVKAWLKDSIRINQLYRFIASMHGHILDGTHHLKGKGRLKEVDRIQREHKDRIWMTAAHLAELVPDDEALAYIAARLQELNKWKAGK